MFKLQYEFLWGVYSIEIWDTQENVLVSLVGFVIFCIDKCIFVPYCLEIILNLK